MLSFSNFFANIAFALGLYTAKFFAFDVKFLCRNCEILIKND